MISLKQLQNPYVQELLAGFGAENLTADEQREMLRLVSDRFNNVVITALVKLLNPSQRAKLEAALAAPEKVPLEEILQDLAAEIPDLKAVLEQAILSEYENLKA